MALLKISMKLKENFDKAKKRLVLLDYDGTLVEFVPRPEKAFPTEKVLSLLNRINNKPDTRLVVISGRGHLDLERFIGHLPIEIIAEHGAMIKLNGSWRNLFDNSDSWKKVVLPVLNRFTFASPNSFVEEKQFSLVWHYRNVPDDVGFLQSRELIRILENSITSLGLKLIDGDKVVEIISNKIGKGSAIKNLINENKFDYIISIGDDKTDEEMFQELSTNKKAETIKVGRGPTVAKHSLENVKQVLLFLEHLMENNKN